MYNDKNSQLPSQMDITAQKKNSKWDWVWPVMASAIIFRVFGIAGGLVTIGCYYWLKPKLGAWGAVGASAVIGVVVALGLMAMIR